MEVRLNYDLLLMSYKLVIFMFVLKGALFPLGGPEGNFIIKKLKTNKSRLSLIFYKESGGYKGYGLTFLGEHL